MTIEYSRLPVLAALRKDYTILGAFSSIFQSDIHWCCNDTPGLRCWKRLSQKDFNWGRCASSVL